MNDCTPSASFGTLFQTTCPAVSLRIHFRRFLTPPTCSTDGPISSEKSTIMPSKPRKNECEIVSHNFESSDRNEILSVGHKAVRGAGFGKWSNRGRLKVHHDHSDTGGADLVRFASDKRTLVYGFVQQ
jgi:hypothetical protein